MMEEEVAKLSVTLHSCNAIIPTKGSAQSAGYDLYAAEDVTIPAMDNGLISTDISVVLPSGTYGRIASRSGLSLKHNLMVGAGVIDYDYTGIVKVVLFNFGCTAYYVKKGARIAQLICEKIVYPQSIVLVNNAPADVSPSSGRANSGFGSTGV